MVGTVAPATAVTVEPGGQIELSGPPEAGVAPAVARLRYEGTAARLALADRRLGLAYARADPARPSRRAPLPRHGYTARGANWAARGRPVSRRRGVCTTDPGRSAHRIVPQQPETTLEGLTMESSASAGRVASAVLDRRRRGR